ncbi:MAG: thioredoxin family protein [Chitinophagaceae bacterium]|nr:thioredoxin family protein [Chitinophagaceae bacterium]MBK9486109.1 thioredoxin family protein [Chitinophagaceae bacterium]
MKKILFGFIAVASLATLAFTYGDPLQIGSTMPKADLKMQDISGKNVAMKDAKKDNGILVMFSCNTCPYVVKNQERTVAISKFATENKVGVIILNSNEALRGDDDSYAAMQTYAKDQGYQWNYVVDKNHEVADAFGANRTPECFLFDKNLKLVYHGAIDNSPQDEAAITRLHLKEAINEMVGGKEVTVKESRSVGCTIKRMNKSANGGM